MHTTSVFPGSLSTPSLTCKKNYDLRAWTKPVHFHKASTLKCWRTWIVSQDDRAQPGDWQLTGGWPHHQAASRSSCSPSHLHDALASCEASSFWNRQGERKWCLFLVKIYVFQHVLSSFLTTWHNYGSGRGRRGIYLFLRRWWGVPYMFTLVAK